MKYNECKRQCRYNYTQEERLEKGRALADEYQALDATNADLDRIKKDYKARIEGHEATISSLAEQVRSGYELRETLCFWIYNDPRAGRKTLKRSDTFDVVGEEDMTGADTQMVMEAVDSAAAEQGSHGADGQPRAIAESSTMVKALPHADLPVTPWPEGDEVIFSSARVSGEDCVRFAELLRSLFYRKDGLPPDDEGAIEKAVQTLVGEHNMSELALFLTWIEERSRPSGRVIAAMLRGYGVATKAPDEDPAPPAKRSRKKKDASSPATPRRVSRGGVVACESDGADIDDPESNKSDY